MGNPAIFTPSGLEGSLQTNRMFIHLATSVSFVEFFYGIKIETWFRIMTKEHFTRMVNSKKMYVKKRRGEDGTERTENVSFDKISTRIESLCYGLDMNYIDPAKIVIKVIEGLYS